MQELMTQPAVSTRETYVSTRELSMKREFNAYAASGPKGRLEPFNFDPGPLEPEDVEIKVTHCGLCHSYLSMLDNEWRMSHSPFVPVPVVTRTAAASAQPPQPLTLRHPRPHRST